MRVFVEMEDEQAFVFIAAVSCCLYRSDDNLGDAVARNVAAGEAVDGVV